MLGLKQAKHKYRLLEKIDLRGVPPQPLILKNSLPSEYADNSRRRPVKEGKSSKYIGVYYESNTYKWKAQMMIKGTVRSLGYFKEEQDAAATYAKAAFKYKAKRANSETHAGMDLSGIPAQPLIPKPNNPSGYMGVHKNKKRWEACIKGITLGTFDTPEKAAGIYARAVVFMYRERAMKKVFPSRGA